MNDNQFWITWWTRVILGIICLWLGTVVICCKWDKMMLDAGYTYGAVVTVNTKSLTTHGWYKGEKPDEPK